MSPTWALMHVRNLPIESAFMAEVRGGKEFRGWSPDRYMTANLINAVRALQYITILAHTDPKKRKPKPPESYPIPDKASNKSRDAKPGSFAFIAKSHINAIKKLKEGGG